MDRVRSPLALLLCRQHGLQAPQALLRGGPLCWVDSSTFSHEVGSLLGALVGDKGGAQVAPHRPLACTGGWDQVGQEREG